MAETMPPRLPGRRIGIAGSGKVCAECRRQEPAIRFPRIGKRCLECSRARAEARGKARKARKAKARKDDPAETPADRAHHEWIRTLPCCCGRCPPGEASDPHHVRTAANSGTGMKPSARNLVPLSHDCHTEGHARGWKTWQRERGINLAGIAAGLAASSPAYAAAPVAKKLLAELV